MTKKGKTSKASKANKPAVDAPGAAPVAATVAATVAAPVAAPVAATEEHKEQQLEPLTDAQRNAAKKQLDSMPTHCAYESPSRTEDPFPLRTHCICDEKPTIESVAQGRVPPWKVCSKQGCKITFHAPCCATTSVSYGLTGVAYDTYEMFCPEHNDEMQKAHKKEQFMLKHMTLQRIAYLERLAAGEAQGATDEEQTLQSTKLRVLGLISDLQLQCVCSSVPVNEGGFAQRNVASQQASQVEQLMRENSYNILAGNLAVVEIPYSDAEVEDLIKAGLLPEDFVPPKRLAKFDEAKEDVKDGSWMIDFKDPKYQMELRRFAIVDGNNRIIALVRITAETPDFLKNTSLNAYLVDLDIHDGLAVQLASMRCNKLSHSFIEDTPGDRIFQFQCVMEIYKKTLPKPKTNKKGVAAAEPKLVVTALCKWIEQNAKDLVDLLPKDFQHSEVVLVDNEVQTFKDKRVAAFVRVAAKASKDFVRWLQQRYAAHQSGAQPFTPGEKKVFVHHFIKMQIVFDSEDPIKFLQEKANQVDRALALSSNFKSWSTERRQMFTLFQSYEKDALACS